MSVLAHSAASDIAGRLAAITLPGHENLREPENGLVMMRGRVGGDGAPFNLGEATVSRASIRLQDGTVGHGQALVGAEVAHPILDLGLRQVEVRVQHRRHHLHLGHFLVRC